jgi:hypothetical protein
MGDLIAPALAAAVGNSGDLGGLEMRGFSAEDATRRIAAFRQQSDGYLNVNYSLWKDPGDLANIGMLMREGLQALNDTKDISPSINYLRTCQFLQFQSDWE